MSDSYLTTKKAADLLMVSQSAIRNWCAQGQLNVHLTPGGHRRFLKQDVQAFARTRGLVLKSKPNDKLRILAVDDDAGVLTFIRELLEVSDDKIELETAEDGFAAGSMMLSFHPDIVLLDLRMPELDGYSVCERIKCNPETRNVRVVAMTGYYSEENVQRILDAGAEICLKKPFDVDELLSVLGINLESRSVAELAV